ncbi:hypothetical protein JXA85_00300 [Candidatus Woesearchaeota archaeon]|nr:hypothetical protein [Candidatus Woesearchaeota archaeon]
MHFRVVEIKKEAEVNSAIIIFIVIMALVLGVISATYISSRHFSETDQPMSAKEMIRGTWNEMMDLLHIRAKNISKTIASLEPRIGLNFTLLPKKCDFPQGFICEDVRVDWQGNRLWFKLKNVQSSSIVIDSVKTEGAVNCREMNPGKSAELNEDFSFILEECTLQKDVLSSIIVNFHYTTSSPEMLRTAEGTFTLTGNS